MELQHTTADIRPAKYHHKNTNQTTLFVLIDSVLFFCGGRYSKERSEMIKRSVTFINKSNEAEYK